MAGILDYNKGIYSTQGFRNSLLNRNLPLPVNETLTQSGLVSKLQDIGTVISVPVNGEANENIPVHYDVNKRLFPLGNLYRTTFKGGFEEGVKWQAGRMYSEEEVLTILYFRSMYQDHFESNDEIKEWFDKFKKTRQ